MVFPVISNLQGVGQNLWVLLQDLPSPSRSSGIVQDQPVASLSFQVNVTTNSQLLTNPGFAENALELYLSSQTGPLTSINGDVVGPLFLAILSLALPLLSTLISRS